jgi:hypothetical protein
LNVRSCGYSLFLPKIDVKDKKERAVKIKLTYEQAKVFSG